MLKAIKTLLWSAVMLSIGSVGGITYLTYLLGDDDQDFNDHVVRIGKEMQMR